MAATFVATQPSGFGASATMAGIRLDPAKPLLRGRLHQLCALASLPLGAACAGPTIR
jgi:hypothetical protein